ncbi:MAG: hypothetical protein JWM34_3197 [Ilumatobacteraceae bacterium]|nr:hypothetical protein [Ilumatobacteraceae bacterium]
MNTVVATVSALFICLAVGAAAGRRSSRRAARRRVTQTGSVAPRGDAAPRWHVLVDTFERRRAARRAVDAGEVAALLDRTARHCASGESLGRALAASIAGSPIALAFAPVSAAMAGGESVEQAMSRQPVDDRHIGLAVHAIWLCATQGGNLSESLDRAAATLRERRAVAQERQAQSAQARLSARVLTILPVAFGGWTILTTASVRHFVATPPGIACVGLGLVLNLAGWAAMQRVVRGAT